MENIVPDDEAVGAIHALARHLIDPDTLFVGAVNGGIWRTRNATALQPSWEQQTDLEGSLSIGSIKFDPADSRHRTLVAGIGLFSAYARIGGARTGLPTVPVFDLKYDTEMRLLVAGTLGRGAWQLNVH